MKASLVAQMVHEATRVQQAAIGEEVSPPWADAPDWMRQSSFDGVESIRTGVVTSPEQSHEAWMAARLGAGWVFGDIKNIEAKTSPCLVAYADLPESQRDKDAVFFALARLATEA